MNKTLIYYFPRSYGTFLEWCLYYFTDPNFSEELPFIGDGSAHKHFDSHWSHIEYTNYARTQQERIKRADELKYQFLRTHHLDLSNSITEIEEYASSFKNIIVIKFNSNCYRWVINNMMTKSLPYDQSKNGVERWLNYFDKVDYHKWGKNRFEDMELWQIRELLSMGGMRCKISTFDYNYEQLADNIITVEIEKLWDNFEAEISSLVSKLGYTLIRKDKIKTIGTEWKKRQVHRFKDHLTKDIVDASIKNIPMNFNDTTIWDEAEIQYQLREAGYEIKCDRLDIFPNNSLDLHKIIYKL